MHSDSSQNAPLSKYKKRLTSPNELQKKRFLQVSRSWKRYKYVLGFGVHLKASKKLKYAFLIVESAIFMLYFPQKGHTFENLFWNVNLYFINYTLNDYRMGLAVSLHSIVYIMCQSHFVIKSTSKPPMDIS